MLIQTPEPDGPAHDGGAVFAPYAGQLTLRAVSSTNQPSPTQAQAMPQLFFRRACQVWGDLPEFIRQDWYDANAATALSPTRNPSWQGWGAALWLRVQVLRQWSGLPIDPAIMSGGFATTPAQLNGVYLRGDGALVATGAIQATGSATSIHVHLSGPRSPSTMVRVRSTRFLNRFFVPASPSTQLWEIDGFTRWPTAVGDQIDARLTLVNVDSGTAAVPPVRLTVTAEP